LIMKITLKRKMSYLWADDASIELPDPPPIEPDPPDPVQTTQPMISRSGRVGEHPFWWQSYHVVNEALLTADSWDEVQENIDHGTLDPIAFAFAASSDPDVTYYDQAMQQPDGDWIFCGGLPRRNICSSIKWSLESGFKSEYSSWHQGCTLCVGP
jgi:hypothetical protein